MSKNCTPSERQRRPAIEPEWTEEHSDRAIEDGWEIFQTDRDPNDEAITKQIVNGAPYGYRPFELQALDDDRRWPDDMAAHIHVMKRALAGNETAIAALKFLTRWSTAEFGAILREYASYVSKNPVSQLGCLTKAMRVVSFVTDVRQYANHKSTCLRNFTPADSKEPCTCGLDALINSYDKTNGEI